MQDNTLTTLKRNIPGTPILGSMVRPFLSNVRAVERLGKHINRHSLLSTNPITISPTTIWYVQVHHVRTKENGLCPSAITHLCSLVENTPLRHPESPKRGLR